MAFADSISHHSQTKLQLALKQKQFEYHTFLHHSQTIFDAQGKFVGFEYHTFLHHSQTLTKTTERSRTFEYHTFLHHSQTNCEDASDFVGLSTIHFYIILKPQIQK